MRRGDVWTVSGGTGYAGKPRPAVIVQGDHQADLESITICPLTSEVSDLHLFRILLEPDMANGLREASRVMIEKVTTVPKRRMGRRIGQLALADLDRLDHALLFHFGFHLDG